MGKLIKDIQRNNTEIIRIEISEFEGKDLINIRTWYRSKMIDEASGEYIYKPTQRGVTLDVSRFDELKQGINELANCIADMKSGSSPDQPGNPDDSNDSND